MLHTYPVNDEQEHDLEGTSCSCGPRVNWRDPETGEGYSEGHVIHNSWDCREAVEEAERIIAKETEL